jgi:hypothetical protein
VAFLLAGLAAGSVGWTLDRPGRLLLSALALILVSEGLLLLLLRPVVRADAAGVTARVGLRRITVPWSAVGVVQARPARRIIAGDTLELDLDERLVVVPAYRLGTSPADAAARIETMRPVSS